MTNQQKDNIGHLLNSHILFNEPLCKYTTFGIGGPADCLVYPNDEYDLSELLKFANKNNIPTTFIGSGSNLLICDEGFNGIVISLRKTFKSLQINNNATIKVGSGTMLGTMVKEAIKNNIMGLENLVGVPGTIGGALIMNAGAYGREISKYFIDAKTMTKTGTIKTYTKDNIKFSYRNSTFPINEILIEATFQCIKGDAQTIQKNRQNVSQNRKSKQPLRNRSAGSIFKNPSNKLAAGYLIEKVGLKGANRGGASISEKHANFIINKGNATAIDVLNLILLAKKRVSKKFGINLKLEVKLIGFSNKIIKEICND